MSRSGYSEDYDEIFPNAGFLYAKNIERAVKGKRGRKFFRDLLAALDAMPVKRLISEDLVRDGEMCALGALGVARGLDMSGLHPDQADIVAVEFGIPECLAREVVFQNDECGSLWRPGHESPETRWQRMRAWVESRIETTA